MSYQMPVSVSPENWLRQMFSSRIAVEGGVFRRKVRDVERLLGRERFLAEIDRRGFHLIENAGNFIVICNQDPVLVLR